MPKYTPCSQYVRHKKRSAIFHPHDRAFTRCVGKNMYMPYLDHMTNTSSNEENVNYTMPDFALDGSWVKCGEPNMALPRLDRLGTTGAKYTATIMGIYVAPR